MNENHTIGQLAKVAGVNVETIRYYERRGLISQPPKPAEGYRTYPNATLARIFFIKRAQELGFTLKEINKLLSLDESHCSEVQELAEVR
jgi:MerR family transcriptional regulator, mercuric resistance operon regulatory protein